MKPEIIRKPQVSGIFTPDCPTDKPERITKAAPIEKFRSRIDPLQSEKACRLGDRCAAEVKASVIADFEKNAAYCEKHPEDHVDRMVHVSTFVILRGVIYMTYYANTGTDAEDPALQEARFAFCPEEDPADLTVIRLLGAGDVLDGRTIDRVYDTILMRRDDDVLYLMWTASAEGMYYRFYCTYTISTGTLSEIRPNRFRVGSVINDFSISGMISALTENGFAHKKMWSDIGIMQKLSTRVENGEVWYYTGAYSGNFNCVIKSRDLVTWEYVSAPDFPNQSQWENAVYVWGDVLYCFVRQDGCADGFLTAYDLNRGTWSEPTLIRDAQSRSDFIRYREGLYLIHAPKDRRGFGIVRIDREDPGRSEPILAADLQESLFYPYTDVYGEEAYVSYTVDRKHIRLSKYRICDYL